MNIGTFHKMHGLGNDFIIVDERDMQKSIDRNKISSMANRYTGIGCDQFIILNHSETADVKMEIFNSDGSKVGACGNASRCVVALLDKDIDIETDSGIINGKISSQHIQVNMGKPQFDWDKIPLAYAMDTAQLPIAWEELNNGFCVNVGNPHIIFFVQDMIEIERLGPLIENDTTFPERINVNIAIIKDGQINLRVWERGAGLTRACGTGACATAVAAISKKLIQSPVQVSLPGGRLNIEWASGEDIYMNGDATHVFTGKTDWDSF